jgi:hypothetical protein
LTLIPNEHEVAMNRDDKQKFPQLTLLVDNRHALRRTTIKGANLRGRVTATQSIARSSGRALLTSRQLSAGR